MRADYLQRSIYNDNINVFRPSSLSLSPSSRLQKSKNRAIVVEKPKTLSAN